MGRDEALAAVGQAITSDNFRLTDHFRQRMDQRGLFFGDIEAVLDAPTDVRADGVDEFGRERWSFAGETTDGLSLEILIAIEVTADGRSIFVTLYWQD